MKETRSFGTIVAIFGPSGSGKSRQKRIFKQNGWNEVVSLVTREPRGVSDMEYDFTPEEDWLKEYEEGKLVNVNKYAGNYYGTRLGDLEEANKTVMITDITNVDGSRGKNDLKNVAEKLGKNLVLAFSAPPEDEEELARRHQIRKDVGEYNDEEFEERKEMARKESSTMMSTIKELELPVRVLKSDEDAEELARALA